MSRLAVAVTLAALTVGLAAGCRGSAGAAAPVAVQKPAGGLLAPDQGALIGPDAASLVGADGASLVGADGGSLQPKVVGNPGAALPPAPGEPVGNASGCEPAPGPTATPKPEPTPNERKTLTAATPAPAPTATPTPVPCP